MPEKDDRASQKLKRRIESAIERVTSGPGRRSAPLGRRVLVALSGGPDSSALLLALAGFGWLDLVAAYFDHGLRSDAERAEERERVEALAALTGVELIRGAGDVRERARSTRQPLEAAARETRYEFLARVARKARCATVATGHTLDDQAETVLLHVLRGSGLRGLGGLEAHAPWPFPGHKGLYLARPLLGLRRADTRAYCEARGWTPVEDASNEAREFLRNRVRHELLPVMRSYNPRVDEALVRLADAAAGAHRFIEAEVERLAPDFIEPVEGGVRLCNLEPSYNDVGLWRAALQRAWQEVTGAPADLTERHIVAVERLAMLGRTGDRLDLPLGVVAERDYYLRGVLLRRTADIPAIPSLPQGAVELIAPAEVRFGHLAVAAGFEALDGSTSVEADAEAVGDRVWVRRRRNGDRIELEDGKTKKLQDLLVDAHVPRAHRDALPVFETDRGIVWVGGVRVAGWAALRPGAPALVLSYRPVEPELA
jgi:tRNA(Ile)-lysidine synthase